MMRKIAVVVIFVLVLYGIYALNAPDDLYEELAVMSLTDDSVVSVKELKSGFEYKGRYMMEIAHFEKILSECDLERVDKEETHVLYEIRVHRLVSDFRMNVLEEGLIEHKGTHYKMDSQSYEAIKETLYKYIIVEKYDLDSPD